ncbi:MAG: NERD domain-containing protein [bacterium]|nr:NERD domain-containing protein [bacterium]
MARIISPAAVSTRKLEIQRKNSLIILYITTFVLLFIMIFFIVKVNVWAIIFVAFVLSFFLYNIIIFSKRIDDAKIGAKAEKYLSDFLDTHLSPAYWVVNDLKIKYGNIDCLVIDTIKNCVFLIEIKSSRRFDSSKISKWIKQCKLSEKLLKNIVFRILGHDVPIFTIISLPFLDNQDYFYHFENSNVWMFGNRKLLEFIEGVPKNNNKVDWYKFIDDICGK